MLTGWFHSPEQADLGSDCFLCRVAEGNIDLKPEQTQLLHQNGLDLGQPQLSSVPTVHRAPETSLQHLLEPRASVRLCPPLSTCQRFMQSCLSCARPQ